MTDLELIAAIAARLRELQRNFSTLSKQEGPRGLQGDKGDKGDQGDRGEQGIQGVEGKRGFRGSRGPKGDPGIQGDRGEKGLPGPRGQRGIQGKAGEPGEMGPMPRHEWDGAKLRFELPGGKWGAWVNLRGPRGSGGGGGGSSSTSGGGERGYSAYDIAVQWGFTGTEDEWLASLTGAQGEPGEQGPQGPQGVTGEQGLQGLPGPEVFTSRGGWDSATAYVVDDWVTHDNLAYYAIQASTNVAPEVGGNAHWAMLTITGPQGPQGIQGEQGIQGPTGPTGPAGPSGGGALSSRLNSAINAAATSLQLTVTGEWPTIPDRVTSFDLLIDNELVTVIATSVVGTTATYTIQRGRYGTTAAAHNKNAVAFLRMLIGPTGPAGGAGDVTFNTLGTGVTDYTLVAADKGKVVEATAATGVAIRVPKDVFTVRSRLELSQFGAGQITVVAAADVQVLSSRTLKSASQYSQMSLYQRAANVWVLGGDTESADAPVLLETP